MSFSYEEYSRIFLFFPLLCIIFLSPILISTARALIRYLQDSFEDHLKDIATSGFVCIIVVLMIIINISTLNSGGVYLFVENEASSVEASGEIERIERVGKHEYQIEVSNTVYTVIEIGEFSEGDHVILEYLPKSRYVLSIQKPENL